MRALGIDGGGTRTRAVMLDEEGRLGTYAEGPSVNLDDHGPAGAEAALRALLASLAAREGSRPRSYDVAFLGLGGVLSRRDREEARALARTCGVAPERATHVHHDAFVALEGGLMGGAGLLVVAGTGSNCFGRDAEGREARCGDWGPVLGDEASGHWLGLEAIRATAQAHDGRAQPGALPDAVLAWLDLDDPEELLRRMHRPGPTRAEVAAFAPTLLALAAEGDATSRAILTRGCDALAHCLAVVAGQLFDGATRVPALTTGGLAAHPAWRDAFHQAVAAHVPAVTWEAPDLPPVLGAGRLALARAGVRVDAATDRNLRRAAEELPAW